MSQSASDGVVTLVIKHRIKRGFDVQYAAWLRRTVSIASRVPGHLGVDVMQGKDSGLAVFTSVLRFTTTDAMQRWLDSDQRLELVKEAAPMLADGDQTEVHAVNEFWFTPATEAVQPPRWKQALVTLSVILPLTLLVPLAWGPVFAAFTWLSSYVISTFLVTVTIVVLVVYLLMPFATRLFAPWLSPTSRNDGDEQKS
jgi:hypothetical protein